MTRKQFLPILLAVLIQAITLVFLLCVIQGAWHLLGLTLPLWAKTLFQMCLAAGLSYLWRLSRWWIVIQFILPAIFIVAISLNLPGWTYGLAFLILIFFFWNSADERVPLYLSNQTTGQALGDLLADEKKPISYIDLGCGLSGTLVKLAKRFPQHSFTGVETAPFPFLISMIRARLSNTKNIKIHRKSLWEVDLANYHYVYAFLSPEPMPRLFNKVQKDMKHGCVFISNSFEVPESPATKTLKLDDKRQTKLHIWEISNL